MADETRLAHARHDRELVAAYAAHDLQGRDLARAEALVTACAACASLAADLRMIAAVTREDAAFIAHAPRDFRLSHETAARARRRSVGDALAAWGRTVAEVRRPLGAAVAALGLAGILAFGLPLAPFLGLGTAGSAGSAARDVGNPVLAPFGEKSAPSAPAGPTIPSNAYGVAGTPGPASSGRAEGGAAPPTASATGAATVSNPGGATDSAGGQSGHDEKSPAAFAFDAGDRARTAIGIGSVALVVAGALLLLAPSRPRRRL